MARERSFPFERMIAALVVDLSLRTWATFPMPERGLGHRFWSEGRHHEGMVPTFKKILDVVVYERVLKVQIEVCRKFQMGRRNSPPPHAPAAAPGCALPRND